MFNKARESVNIGLLSVDEKPYAVLMTVKGEEVILSAHLAQEIGEQLFKLGARAQAANENTADA